MFFCFLVFFVRNKRFSEEKKRAVDPLQLNPGIAYLAPDNKLYRSCSIYYYRWCTLLWPRQTPFQYRHQQFLLSSTVSIFMEKKNARNFARSLMCARGASLHATALIELNRMCPVARHFFGRIFVYVCFTVWCIPLSLALLWKQWRSPGCNEDEIVLVVIHLILITILQRLSCLDSCLLYCWPRIEKRYYYYWIIMIGKLCFATQQLKWQILCHDACELLRFWLGGWSKGSCLKNMKKKQTKNIHRMVNNRCLNYGYFSYSICRT